MKIYNADQIKGIINLEQDLESLIKGQKQEFIYFSSGIYNVLSPMQLSFQRETGDCHIILGVA